MNMWVRRNAHGKIEAAAFDKMEGYDEELPTDNPELVAFLTNQFLPADFYSKAGREGLIERRARAFDRKGTTEAQLAAINLRMGV